MKLNIEQYPMNDVLRQFSDNGWGYEDAVLEALAEGALVGSIKFPSYALSWKDVPVDHWQSMTASELITESSRRPGNKQIDEVMVEGQVLFDTEFEQLKTIAKAAADHNFELIDERLLTAVTQKLDVETVSGFNDWLNLIRVFHELATELNEKSRESYPVFVSSENWKRFASMQTTPGKTPQYNDGRPLNPYWPDLLWALIEKIALKQKMGIVKLAGFTSRAELSKEIRSKVLKDKSLQESTLVKVSRIEDEIGKRERAFTEKDHPK